jgi:hypothetical protein
MSHELIYKGHYNELVYRLSSTDIDGNVIYPDMEAITEMRLYFKGVFYSSEDYEEAFDWTTYASDHAVIFKFGLIEDIELGKDAAAEIIIIATDYPDPGIIWNTLALHVVELEETVSE